MIMSDFRQPLTAEALKENKLQDRVHGRKMSSIVNRYREVQTQKIANKIY